MATDEFRSYAHTVKVLRSGPLRGIRVRQIVYQRLRSVELAETRQVVLQVLRDKSDPLSDVSKSVVFVVSS